MANSGNRHLKGLVSVSPLIVFLVTYVVTSLVAKDFYKVPLAAAFILASAYGLFITPGGRIQDRIAIFSSGAGEKNVLLMIWIFVLAGAFASTAKDIGAIDATVALTLRILPERWLFAGLFVASCFISMAIGTSVGTIVALVPIAAGIASSSGQSVPFMTAIVVGGAFFGDNLSFISDTTVAATKTQGCSMRDKFRANIAVALPSALIVAVIYFILGSSSAPVYDYAAGSAPLWKLLPYLTVIVLALAGMDVTAVLGIGIVLNGILGISSGAYGWVGWMSSIGGGISGMGELIIVTLLAGGLLALIRRNGGMDYIFSILSGRIRGRRGAEFGIAGLVSLVNLCTANNTIAILTAGPLARDISDRYGLNPRRCASILDTFSCFVQGIIPYGAQLLMASGLSGVSAASIIPNLYYPFVLGIIASLAIIMPYRNR